MKIKIGDKIDDIVLPSVDGNEFNTSNLKGKKVLLTFYRFARCPMCNLRINDLKNNQREFGNNFSIVGIFHSEIKNLIKAMDKHDVPFHFLADADYKYFSKYDVKTSIWGLIKASLFRVNRFNKAMLKGYIPFPVRGYFNILPVDLLINEEGIVEKVKYANDIGDHLPLDEVINFSKNS